MNSMYKDYPFNTDEHTEFILKQLNDVHDDYGFPGTPVYIESFSKEFFPTRKNDANTLTIIKCLEEEGVIEICEEPDTEKFSTPLEVLPEFEGVPRHKVVIKKPNKIECLYEKISFRNKSYDIVEMKSKLITTRIETDSDYRYALILHTNKGSYTLWVFNEGTTGCALKHLTDHLVLKRKNGKIKIDDYKSEVPVSKLNDLACNVGFTKKLKDIFFEECGADILSLKPYPVILDGREVDQIVSIFEDKGKRNKKHNSKKHGIKSI